MDNKYDITTKDGIGNALSKFFIEQTAIGQVYFVYKLLESFLIRSYRSKASGSG